MEPTTLSEYQEALRDLLLYIMHQPCPRRAHQGAVECRVLRFLPQLVNLVANMPSGPPAAMREAMRTRICSQCEYQDANGYCPLRMSGECCLSREEAEVIAVISRVTQRRPAAPDTSSLGRSGNLSS